MDDHHRSVTKWNTACGKRQARLKSMSTTRNITDHAVLLEVRLRTAELDCFRTHLLLEMYKIQNKFQAGYCAYLDHKQLIHSANLRPMTLFQIRHCSERLLLVSCTSKKGRHTSITIVGLCIGSCRLSESSWSAVSAAHSATSRAGRGARRTNGGSAPITVKRKRRTT